MAAPKAVMAMPMAKLAARRMPPASREEPTPARPKAGVRFFEALIDDQLLPTKAFGSLLERHGFGGVASFELSPVHVVVHGRKA